MVFNIVWSESEGLVTSIRIGRGTGVTNLS